MRPARQGARRAAAALIVCAAAALGCTRYEDDPTITLSVPSRDDFDAVDAVLEVHCGTLDCHGSPARNFRVFGVYGLRLNGSDVTGSPDTTEAEVTATYEAIVTVDPESLSAVYHDRGRDPQRWLAVRKSRGLENHTGGAPLPAGGHGDRCLIAWLGKSADQSDCTEDVFGPVPRDGGAW
ncbi:MAG TPA: hypothetical protein VHC69_04805 [Polyangiaceae bacterium]|nr:hypothetical protein [Polyangiaceae bacterium]